MIARSFSLKKGKTRGVAMTSNESQQSRAPDSEAPEDSPSFADEQLESQGLEKVREVLWRRVQETRVKSDAAARQAKCRAARAEDGIYQVSVMASKETKPVIQRIAIASCAGVSVDEALAKICNFNRQAELIGKLVLATPKWRRMLIRRLMVGPSSAPIPSAVSGEAEGGSGDA